MAAPFSLGPVPQWPADFVQQLERQGARLRGEAGGEAEQLRRDTVQLIDAVRKLLPVVSATPDLVDEASFCGLAAAVANLAPACAAMDDGRYAQALRHVTSLVNVVLLHSSAAKPAVRQYPARPTVFPAVGTHEDDAGSNSIVVASESLVRRTLRRLAMLVTMFWTVTLVLVGVYKVAATTRQLAGGAVTGAGATALLTGVAAVSSYAPFVASWLATLVPGPLGAARILAFVPSGLLPPQYEPLFVLGVNLYALVLARQVTTAALRLVATHTLGRAYAWILRRFGPASAIVGPPLLPPAVLEQLAQQVSEQIVRQLDAQRAQLDAADRRLAVREQNLDERERRMAARERDVVAGQAVDLRAMVDEQWFQDAAYTFASSAVIAVLADAKTTGLDLEEVVTGFQKRLDVQTGQLRRIETEQAAGSVQLMLANKKLEVMRRQLEEVRNQPRAVDGAEKMMAALEQLVDEALTGARKELDSSPAPDTDAPLATAVRAASRARHETWTLRVLGAGK